jgi:hypothetical protein
MNILDPNQCKGRIRKKIKRSVDIFTFQNYMHTCQIGYEKDHCPQQRQQPGPKTEYRKYNKPGHGPGKIGPKIGNFPASMHEPLKPFVSRSVPDDHGKNYPHLRFFPVDSVMRAYNKPQ